MRLTKDMQERIDDLKIQAMMFDMSIDWETLSLVEKPNDNISIWVKRWREKQAESDYTVYDNGN